MDRIPKILAADSQTLARQLRQHANFRQSAKPVGKRVSKYMYVLLINIYVSHTAIMS